MGIVKMDWDYYQIINGNLYNTNKSVFDYNGEHEPFKSIEEAENWLIEKDYRGNVIEFIS